MKCTVRMLAVSAALLAVSATAQTRWGLASVYTPTNVHTEYLVQFAVFPRIVT